MVIIVPTGIKQQCEPVPFKVTEVMYKSLCGNYVVYIDDVTGEEVKQYRTIDSIKFRWWKYKDWKDEWVLIK